MRTGNNSLIRSVIAILLGLILIFWPELTITYLVITIGVCFILPGVFALLNHFTRKRVEGEPSPMFPIEAAGSVLLGAWLVIMPQFFVNILMYVLGAILVLAGAHKIYVLVNVKRVFDVPHLFFLFPVLILITGIMILVYPFAAAANTFVIFGVASLFYGIIEILYWYKFRKISY